MANLFVTSGDFQAATALYENVISQKQNVHGEFSVATAKTVNDYAVILAKNGRMDDALARYEKARATYERALDGLPPPMSWLNHGESAAKCGFDMAQHGAHKFEHCIDQIQKGRCCGCHQLV